MQNLFKVYKNMGCNISLRSNFLDSHIDYFFQQTVGQIVANMVKGFTKIWKSGTRANGAQECLQTNAGH